MRARTFSLNDSPRYALRAEGRNGRQGRYLIELDGHPLWQPGKPTGTRYPADGVASVCSPGHPLQGHGLAKNYEAQFMHETGHSNRHAPEDMVICTKPSTSVIHG